MHGILTQMVPYTLLSLQEAFEDFQQLEDRITLVATKVVHLGDQLESSNNRRARDFEAETLMRYLAEFHAGPKPVSHIFNDPGQVSAFVVSVWVFV